MSSIATTTSMVPQNTSDRAEICPTHHHGRLWFAHRYLAGEVGRGGP